MNSGFVYRLAVRAVGEAPAVRLSPLTTPECIPIVLPATNDTRYPRAEPIEPYPAHDRRPGSSPSLTPGSKRTDSSEHPGFSDGIPRDTPHTGSDEYARQAVQSGPDETPPAVSTGSPSVISYADTGPVEETDTLSADAAPRQQPVSSSYIGADRPARHGAPSGPDEAPPAASAGSSSVISNADTGPVEETYTLPANEAPRQQPVSSRYTGVDGPAHYEAPSGPEESPSASSSGLSAHTSYAAPGPVEETDTFPAYEAPRQQPVSSRYTGVDEPAHYGAPSGPEESPPASSSGLSAHTSYADTGSVEETDTLPADEAQTRPRHRDGFNRRVPSEILA